MITIVNLDSEGAPAANERYLIVDWTTTKFGTSVLKEPNGLRYLVGVDKHYFWATEARHLAKRLGFDRVYYKGTPLALSDRQADQLRRTVDEPRDVRARVRR